MPPLQRAKLLRNQKQSARMMAQRRDTKKMVVMATGMGMVETDAKVTVRKETTATTTGDREGGAGIVFDVGGD